MALADGPRPALASPPGPEPRGSGQAPSPSWPPAAPLGCHPHLGAPRQPGCQPCSGLTIVPSGPKASPPRLPQCPPRQPGQHLHADLISHLISHHPQSSLGVSPLIATPQSPQCHLRGGLAINPIIAWPDAVAAGRSHQNPVHLGNQGESSRAGGCSPSFTVR